MKKPILFFFLFLLSTLQAQNLAVQSFRVLENDLDARVHHSVKDQNGDLAALIKVNTTQSNFKFEVGSLGVVKTVQKTGEIWVYVPEKVQRITISHSQLGLLRNFSFPIPIEKAKVYELVLVSGKVETVVKEAEIETQWIAINSTPSGANVFLNDRLVGKTPYSGQFQLGTYSYKLELPKYHTEAGSILLKNSKVVLEPVLKPKYGNIKISTSPESGMAIYLDNENTGKKSPFELKEISSGQHSVKIISDWYAPQSKNIVVEDGKTTTVDFKLEPEFAEINIKSNPQATIFINGERKASGSFNERLLSGVYTLKVEESKHYTIEQKLIVEPGKNQNLTLEPKAITGNLAITSTPFGANILINGKNYGTTPETIKNLLIGNYTLELQLKGHKTLKKQITIQENKTLELNENLVAGSDAIIKYVKIGTQTWMTENLNVDRFKNGDLIPHAKSNEDWEKAGNNGEPAWCYYDNDPSNGAKYGKLYNWYAVNDPRGLAPEGWKIPSHEDWNRLRDFLGGERIAGKKMKYTDFWTENMKNWFYDYDSGNGTNESGFSGLPGGVRGNDGTFGRVGGYGYWWSSTVYDTEAWGSTLYHFSSSLGRSTFLKQAGFSVRCIKH